MDFYKSALFATIVPCFNLSLCVTVFALSAYHFVTEVVYERKADASMGNINRKSSLMIVLFSLTAGISTLTLLLTNVWGVIGVSHIDENLCKTILPKFYSTTYVLANTALYQFLNTRSELVRSACDDIKYFKWLRILTRLLANVVPFLCILTLYFWNAEIVMIDGRAYCVDALRWELSLLFACLSFPISILFLILFIWPLFHHYSRMKTEQLKSVHGDAILKVMKRNTILSVIAMTSTMIAMLFMSITSKKAEKEMLSVTTAIANLDLSVNLTCMCLMTDQWLPNRVKEMILRAKGISKATVLLSGPGSPSNSAFMEATKKGETIHTALNVEKGGLSLSENNSKDLSKISPEP